MDVDTDTIVIGAGVVGLAMARRLAMAGREVLIVDQAGAVGTVTSSRNSEVIHAGIYYAPGSLKAKLCVEGRQLLYRFCKVSGVEARAIGKLIVAQTENDVAKLAALHATAMKNGVTDLEWLTPNDICNLEPELKGVSALLSPSTGIIDSHGFMLALLASAEEHGATISLRTSVLAGDVDGSGIVLTLQDEGGTKSSLNAKTAINCAGHGAHAIAKSIKSYNSSYLPPQFFAKGSYCSVSGKSPFSHLVYPLPVPGALGIHVTLDLQGRARLGPDIEWISSEDYSVSDSIVPHFISACQGFWPGMKEREISPSYSGVRPKIHGPDVAFADFVIQGPREHHCHGLVNLFGIESPGLTASLAIANHVLDLIDDREPELRY